MKTDKGNNLSTRENSRWAIRALVPEKVYTNRKEHFDYLYKTAIKVHRPSDHVCCPPRTAAVGQNRDIQAGGEPSLL